ncbi:GNAT family N-acetyltransferase [Alginatibacterium sediminis]|uniref:GNAT family N-acetyltransferase n=1 Tax=Alginatibacterium sediminis TaxID=2164068 RepID=A0A420EG55_9ALTE|nr:GNAT family N-acetyltransferase [Alginatibacterium sediminis]RKF19644.1 GNAT family N-acetyltransferase [Alginatibacterium sediminis]
MNAIHYTVNQSTYPQIEKHLEACYEPESSSLRKYVVLTDYAMKIFSKAEKFEAWVDGTLVGLVAVYMNTKQSAHVTNVSVLKNFTGEGIATILIERSIVAAINKSLDVMTLEVELANHSALSLYRKIGFVNTSVISTKQVMNLDIKGRDETR